MAGAGSTFFVSSSPIQAQPRPTLRIGVLSALTGEYSDAAGSVPAVQMAVEDFTRKNSPDFAVEVVAGDMLDKPDIGIGVARTWFDRGAVDAVIDMPNSAVALGVANLVKEKNKVALFTGPGIASLTGTACGYNHVHWDYDTWSVAKTTAAAMTADGAKTWFFITADYAFGHAFQYDTSEFIRQGGGKVLGWRRIGGALTQWASPDTKTLTYVSNCETARVDLDVSCRIVAGARLTRITD